MIEHFKSDEHAWLSNFESCTIILDGISYPSVEHAFVSAKCDIPTWKVYCSVGEPNAGKVKRKGKDKTVCILRADWESIKVNVMRNCIDQKFNQEPLRSKLINTGNEYLQEGNWWNDTFWGVSLKTTPPKGENILGKLLMEKRESLNSIDLI